MFELIKPKYDGFIKNIYFCQVVFLTDSRICDGYLPLELISDTKRKKLLEDIETVLIQTLKPSQNIMKTKKYKLNYPIGQIHISNFVDTIFLNDVMCGPLNQN